MHGMDGRHTLRLYRFMIAQGVGKRTVPQEGRRGGEGLPHVSLRQGFKSAHPESTAHVSYVT